MCGRYTLSKREHILRRHRLVLLEDEFKPRYNIAPTQEVPVIFAGDDGNKALSEMRWGLVPNWVRDLKTHKLLINARVETLTEKQSFKKSLANRRCLILADGFYEWRVIGGKKAPVYIHLKDNEPFCFAGLWDRWISADGEVIDSCTIVTVPANSKLSVVHSRMPAILSEQAEETWLDRQVKESEALLPLLLPYDDTSTHYYSISTLVNSAAVDSADCIARLEE